MILSTITHNEKKGFWMRRAALASMTVGAILTLSKAVVWVMTGSVAMLGSLTDSALDFMASVITFMGVRTALTPPDADHRFGHGKAEGLAALAQSAIMLGSASFLALEAVTRLFRPQAIEQAWAGIAISIFSIVLTGALVTFQYIVIKRTESLAIGADHLHYKGDLLLNLAVIAGLVLSGFGGLLWIDGVFGLAIAGYIGFGASRIVREAIDVLMDKEMDDSLREEIFNLILGNSAVLGLHDLKTRHAGLHDFIQFHIEIAPDSSLKEAHLVSLEVEAALGERFPNAEIIIKIDPAGFEKPNLTVQELDGHL